MQYRLTSKELIDALTGWNAFLRRKIRLIACGGTALTLLGIKPSTKDVDFMVPEEAEYDYLIKTIKELGYKQQAGSGWSREGELYIFDLFRGNNIHTTELLESPLEEGNNVLVLELSHIYIGALNYYDLIISKLFRGETVDMDDCISLVKARKDQIDIDFLKDRFIKTVKYEIAAERVTANLEHFFKKLKKEGLL
jgi:hypothetical protein